jgi:hypothetical protein
MNLNHHIYSAMGFFEIGKLRILYLLALAQLVGGPLVLLHVTVFCKVALQNVPRVGMKDAAVLAWHSDDFQAALVTTDFVGTKESKSLPPGHGPKLKLEKGKVPFIAWTTEPVVLAASSCPCEHADRARTWTPAWPQAPPGPPPRVG